MSGVLRTNKVVGVGDVNAKVSAVLGVDMVAVKVEPDMVLVAQVCG